MQYTLTFEHPDQGRQAWLFDSPEHALHAKRLIRRRWGVRGTITRYGKDEDRAQGSNPVGSDAGSFAGIGLSQCVAAKAG